MRRFSIRGIYDFGASFRFLLHVSEEYVVKGDGHILYVMDLFRKTLNTLDLVVTSRVSDSVLSELQTTLDEYEDGVYISEPDAATLKDKMSDIQKTLEAELAGRYTYQPGSKRFDVTTLLDDVGNLFYPNTFDQLPDIARYDFREAGKCIAYEMPTSAAFHILRGTEGVLVFYYKNMVKQNRIKKFMWAAIVSDLRGRARTKKHSALNNHLDHIRDSFRNPTAHPEAIYDIHQVNDLLPLCIDVVNRMMKILRDEKRL